MRFFKHGAVLAISLPESLRLKLGIQENDEYEFLESDGSLVLTKKTAAMTTRPPRPSDPIHPPAANVTPTPATPPTIHPPKPPAAKSAPFVSTNTALDRQGFLVLSTEDEAKAFSYRFESQIKTGDIKGVRGFDKKFYLASRAYTEAFADKLLIALKEPKTSADLSAVIKQPLEGVLTLLYLLKEEGEVIEKKRGLFARVL